MRARTRRYRYTPERSPTRNAGWKPLKARGWVMTSIIERESIFSRYKDGCCTALVLGGACCGQTTSIDDRSETFYTRRYSRPSPIHRVLQHLRPQGLPIVSLLGWAFSWSSARKPTPPAICSLPDRSSLHQLLQPKILPSRFLSRLCGSRDAKRGMLVGHYIVLVFRIRGLMVWRDIDLFM